MTWTSPPTKIVEARDAMLQSATVQAILTAAGVTNPTLQAARFHYPSADPANDAMPHWVLLRASQRFRRVTTSGTFGEGEIDWTLFVDASTATGDVEAYVGIADDLCMQQADSLFITEASVDRASLPTAALQATDDGGQVETGNTFIAISGRMTWEG